MINKARSFRYEIIIISFLSLFCTLLTGGGVFLFIKLIQIAVMGDEKKGQGMGTNKEEKLPHNIDVIVKKPNSDTHGGLIRDNTMLFIFLILSFVLFVILYIFYFLVFSKRFSIALKEIAFGIQEVSFGNFDSKISVNGNDEFALIAEQVNDMVKQVNAILSEERQNEEIKNELITNVAHDLRTPLTSIIGYLYLLSNNENLNKEQREHYIEIAYSKSKRLEELIEDLFRYTKYSTEQVKMNFQKIDFVQLMKQMGEEFYPSLQNSELHYSFKSNVKNAFVLADGCAMARAVGNLLSNAVKYGKDGKEINVTIYAEHEKMILSIQNYGRVIPEEKLQHIFERFYRVEESRSEETGGSGLGLAIAQKIVQLHKGSIKAESNINGTVFHLILNLCEEV